MQCSLIMKLNKKWEKTKLNLHLLKKKEIQIKSKK